MTLPRDPAPGGPARLTLLVRAYCHLCDEMADALRPLAQAYGVTVDLIDVDDAGYGNGPLEAAWGDRVPVLFAGAPDAATELCHYRLDRRRVELVLSGAGKLARDAEIR
ncbi:MAG: glutaredoxin family protein [Betaproteobacteria bacterium]